MDATDIQKRDKAAMAKVNANHKKLSEITIRGTFPMEVMTYCMLGTKLQVKGMNFIHNEITFELVD